MATTMTTIQNAGIPVTALAGKRVKRRRISAEAGHALEILGHAVEYLADEHIYNGGVFSSSDPCTQAIQILMTLNREIYFACPEVPTLGERILSWLRIRTA